jgi:nucleoid-associated protein YgaU
MILDHWSCRSFIAAVALFLQGCGGSGVPPQAALEPASAPTEQPETEAAAPEPVEEPPLEARWRAPFAVSSVGRTAPREPRQVAIIGADPVIADALTELRSGAAAALADAADDADDPRDPRRTDGDRIEPPAPEPASEAEEDAPVTHRVRPGDTLWGIARRYDVTPEAILEANDLENDRVRLGQILSIPAAEDGS